MARSVKKGPYIVPSVKKKIDELNRTGEKRVVRTWARPCTITPDFVGPYPGDSQWQ